MQKYVNVEHFHDMSKFLFGFVFFWSYITFSQFMLFWYGNIPEETIWFKIRMSLADGWGYVGILLILGRHFALPMLGCCRDTSVETVLSCAAGLCSCWSCTGSTHTFIIMPQTGATSVMMWLSHAVCAVGMISVFLSLPAAASRFGTLGCTTQSLGFESLSYHVM